MRCDFAALLKSYGYRDAARVEREAANEQFRVTLGECGVPWTRRWVTWAGVQLQGYVKHMPVAALTCVVLLLAWWAAVPAALRVHGWARVAAIGTYFVPVLVPVFVGAVLASTAIWLVSLFALPLSAPLWLVTHREQFHPHVPHFRPTAVLRNALRF